MAFVVQGMLEFDASGALKNVRVAKTEFEKLGASGINLGKGLRATNNQLRVTGAETSGARQAQLRNFAAQINQIGQQGAATGNYMQAFAIQLGDIVPLLGGAGLAGVAATAAGALTPLAMALAQADESVATFEHSLDDLIASVGNLQEVTSVFSSEGLTDLEQKYGSLTDQVLGLVEAQRQFAMTDAVQSATAAAEALRTEFRDVFLELGRTDFIDARRLEWFEERFGITIDKAKELRTALDAAAQADTFETQAAALAKVRAILDQTALKASETYGNLLDAESAMRQLANQAPKSGWLSGMIAEAKTLGEDLWDAVKARAELEKPVISLAGGRGGDPRQFEDDPYWRSRYFPTPERGSDKRRSVGGAAAAKERNTVADLIVELEREAAIRAASDPVMQEMIRLRGRMAGATDAERARIEDLLRAQIAGRTALEQQQQAWQTWGDFALTAINDVSSAMDILLQAFQQGALLGTGPLGALFGGTNEAGAGGLLGMAFGGFRAGGGDVMPGRAYEVGERGRELFVPGVSGAIVPHDALGGGYAPAPASLSVTVRVEGAMGDRDLEARAMAGARAGIAQALADYDAVHLPLRIREITDNPERIG